MRQGFGCVCHAKELRSNASIGGAASIAAVQGLPPGMVRSAFSVPELHSPAADCTVQGARFRATSVGFNDRTRRSKMDPLREYRRENLFSDTRLAGTVLYSQSHDPHLAEAAREKVLAVGRANPRKPNVQPLRIASRDSPYHARAMKLLAVHRGRPSPILEESAPVLEPSSTGGNWRLAPESVRRAKYDILPLRERSPKNRGNARYFASLARPGFSDNSGQTPLRSSKTDGYLSSSIATGVDIIESKVSPTLGIDILQDLRRGRLAYDDARDLLPPWP